MALKISLLILCTLLALNAFAYDYNDELKGIEFLSHFLPANVTGRKYCPTEDVWRWKETMRRAGAPQNPLACATQGNCDSMTERNRWTNKLFNIRLYFHIICCTSTNCNGVTDKRIDDQLEQINEDFAGTGFHFTIGGKRFIVNATSCELAAYSSNNLWYTQLQGIKNTYAVSPSSYLNVFITAQRSGTQGTLLGIGTFPWDSAANQNTGGLWVNANYVKKGDKTASHEIGHNVGLWHAFHGVSEVACTNGCYEVVHQGTSNTDPANEVGDFCADTPSQPTNYECRYPTGADCKGNLFTKYGNNPVLINNIMAYTPDNCMQSFTPQQVMRAHCWCCSNRIRGYDSAHC